MDKIYTKSVKAISYVSFITGQMGSVEESDKSGLNVFTIEKNTETMSAYKKYKDIVARQDKMEVDLIKFDNLIKKYKDMCKEFSRRG